MKKRILLAIGLSINMFSFAATDLNLNQLLLLGTILEQIRLQRERNNPLVVPQPIREHLHVQTRERYKTLKRNQPPRYHKRQQ